MPIFTVLRRQDAYVDYTAEVEADTADEAADLAYEAWRMGEALAWVQQDVVEFDANVVVALDEDGVEIESTAHGKLS